MDIRASVRREWRLVLAAAVASGVLGFGIGTWRSGAHIAVGHGDASANSDGTISTDDASANGDGTISKDNWSYGFPARVPWTDAFGTLHDCDQPVCLPPAGPSAYGLRFAWVEVTAEGSTWRPAVWVDCGSVTR